MENHSTEEPIVFVLDDDADVREGLKALLESVNLKCEVFASTKEFLRRKLGDEPSCLILDVRLPGPSGLDFQHELVKAQIHIPVIMVSGHGDVHMTVRAMKAGAVDFLTKPIHEQDLLDSIYAAFEREKAWREQERGLTELRKRFESLSERERQVMSLVTAGLLNKQSAAEIGLSEATVKVHRHNLMKKLGAKSLPDLVRFADMLGIGRSSNTN